MEKDYLEICMDAAEEALKKYDIDGLLEKMNIIKYILPFPEDYQNSSIEFWDEEDELHYRIPNKEELEFILMDLFINTFYIKDDNGFCDINVIYNNGNPYVDETYFDNEIKELEKFREEYEYDKTYVLPTKNYKGNCSKEFCEKIVEKFWEREFIRIQYIEFPPLGFYDLTLKKCENEFKKLQKTDGTLNSRVMSPIIRYFHQSIIFSSVGNGLSPYEGWQYLKSDEEVFKNFYRNRLRYSDWYKAPGRTDYFLRGIMTEEMYGLGLSTSRKFQSVTYFKPNIARYIVKNYLNDYNIIFDPFSGYSGRMIGVLASGKSYIGQDLCEPSVEESKMIYDFLTPYLNENQSCDLSIKDSIKETGKYECLLTCPPYGNIENWLGVESLNYNCDKWIDICIKNYDCERYVFVVDNNIEKYKKYIVDSISNLSHLGKNKEYILVIDKKDLKDIG